MAYTVEDLLRGGGMAAPEEDPGFQPMQKDQYEIAALLATLPDSEVELTRMLYEQQQAQWSSLKLWVLPVVCYDYVEV